MIELTREWRDAFVVFVEKDDVPEMSAEEIEDLLDLLGYYVGFLEYQVVRREYSDGVRVESFHVLQVRKKHD